MAIFNHFQCNRQWPNLKIKFKEQINKRSGNCCLEKKEEKKMNVSIAFTMLIVVNYIRTIFINSVSYRGIISYIRQHP